jgi:DNA-binding transcriptional MerR regulator
MEPPIDIRDVARMTGLTSRALRFYEARGLLEPLRTYSGRRLYGRAELERVNQIVALKRAGLSLSQIGELTRDRTLDLGALIDAQLEVLEARKSELEEARSLLLSVKSRIGRGEPVDAATFCSLINNEELTMTKEQWGKVTDRYFSPDEKAQWAEKGHGVPPGLDHDAYNRQWKELGERITAVIPKGPDSKEARTLYDEWQKLLAPFKALATPDMLEGASKLYERMGEWEGEVNAPFNSDAYAFIQEIGRRRADSGAGGRRSSRPA